MTIFRRLHQQSHHDLFRAAAPVLLGGALLFASSCGSARPFGRSAFNQQPASQMQAGQGVQHAYTDSVDPSGKMITQLDHQARESAAPTVQEQLARGEDPFLSSPTASTNHVDPAFQPASAAMPAGTASAMNAGPYGSDKILQTSAEVIERAQRAQLQAAARYAPEPRVPIHSPPIQQVSGVECPTGTCPPTSVAGGLCACGPIGPEIIGDEYVCDGGDRDTKVYHYRSDRYGLNTEDTVGEWVDEMGELQVKPSTRTCVYAPRFGSVRSATLPQVGIDVDGVAGHHDRVSLAGMDTKQILDEKSHTDEALAMLVRSRASGLEHKAADDSLHQNIAPQHHVKLLNVYQDIVFLKEGLFDKIDRAALGESIAAAQDWTGDQGVVIYAHDQAGQEVQSRVFAQDYTGVEDKSQPGDLAIVKAVDKTTAKPGEELTFTIRFDNTGDRPLSLVRIVDNLSPRLEFIEDSVDSNLDGSVDTEDNGQGSQILTFKFDNPLEGHTGGWVSFKCRVR
ncbi:DUF11 domain-containing protein [Thalassoglobus sp. JC818]|uniref:DUF11 domain-containing protein n=1 Tax=Thalassoglobus sp. JC818 TaxID=3232136 RepID=UPI0034591EDC